jgi:hypothetical protein
MRYTPLFAAALALAVGCGPKEEPKKEAVPLDQVPDNVMTVAKEKLPDVKFERAVRKPNGEYEILGKDKTGKVREIDITPSGEVTEIDK